MCVLPKGGGKPVEQVKTVQPRKTGGARSDGEVMVKHTSPKILPVYKRSF